MTELDSSDGMKPRLSPIQIRALQCDASGRLKAISPSDIFEEAGNESSGVGVLQFAVFLA